MYRALVFLTIRIKIQSSTKQTMRRQTGVILLVSLAVGIAMSPRAFGNAAPVKVGAKPVFQSRPQYPLELRKKGISGKVKVRFSVTRSGDVDDVRILSATDPLFGEAAKLAVEKWIFRAATVDGKPVRSEIVTMVEFNLVSWDAIFPTSNKQPDPTSKSVTPPAGAGGAPSSSADH